jgi:hypothetical protein
VTDLSVAVPETVAEKCSVPPVDADADDGEMLTPVTVGAGGGGVGAFTVTLVVSDLLGSATLVAVTVSVPAFDGAVYCPAAVIVPRTAFHVTALLVVVPATLAVNVSVPLVDDEAAAGDTVTDVTVGAGGGAAVTVTLAVSDLLGSAELVAVTVSVPALTGAV